MSLSIPALGVCLVTATPASAVSLQELVGFLCTSTSCPYGQAPNAIIQASDGNFYGIEQGSGAIFQMTPTGQLTLL